MSSVISSFENYFIYNFKPSKNTLGKSKRVNLRSIRVLQYQSPLRIFNTQVQN